MIPPLYWFFMTYIDDIDVDIDIDSWWYWCWSGNEYVSTNTLITWFLYICWFINYLCGLWNEIPNRSPDSSTGRFNLDQKLPEHISRINSFVSSLSIYQRSDHSAYIQGAILDIVFDIGWLHMFFWYRRHLVIILQYFSQFRFWIVTILERRQISKNILGELFINEKRTFYYLFTHIRNGHNMSYMLVIGIENVSDRTQQVNWCFRTFFQNWWLIY